MVTYAKLELDDFDTLVDLETFEWKVTQPMTLGQENGGPRISNLSFRIKGANNFNHFFAWSKAPNKMVSGKVKYLMGDAEQIAHTLRFTDARCKSCLQIFDKNDSEPAFFDLELSVAFDKYSFDDDTSEKENEAIPVTPAEEKNEGEYTKIHLENEDGEEIDSYKIGDIIILVVETKDRIGKRMKITIDDKDADFEFRGRRLSNDTLNHKVMEDVDRIKLKVLEQA